MREFVPHIGTCRQTAKSHPYFHGYLKNWLMFFSDGRAAPRSAAPIQMGGQQSGPTLPR
jgi:hypothetical protein